MRNVIFFALLLASSFQTALGAVEGQWTYIVENGGATITASTATGAVTIPSQLVGLPVKKVGNTSYKSVFGYPNTSLITVTIPNTVTSIGDYAFSNCTSLVIVTIPSSVTSIGQNAFAGCNSLFTINLPSSLISIGQRAFNGCYALTSITIPNSVISIGTDAFSACTALTSINIPSSVTSIGSGTFSSCYALTSITIPNLVTSIGDNAFNSCYALTSITIPNLVTSIGDNAFYSCRALTSITIPNSVTSIGNSAFYDCRALTTITIPNSVISIGTDAFNGCTALTSITMPDRYIAQVAEIGFRGQVAVDYLVNALANNDAFVTAVANKIKATGGNYGLSVKSELESLATKSGLSSAIEPLATKSELTSALTESRTAGVNSVLSNPNLWTLYTTSQIQNMAVGDLVLTKNVGGAFTLNYDIEQSTDLQTWTPYQALSLPLTGLPTDKAFVRIKAKQ